MTPSLIDLLPQGVGVLTAVRDARGQVVDFTVELVNRAGRAALGDGVVGQLLSRLEGRTPFDRAVLLEVVTGGQPVDRRGGDAELHAERGEDGAVVVTWWPASGAGKGPSPELQAICDAMEDGLVVFDGRGQAIIVNQAEARLCGYPDPEAMKQDLPGFARVFTLEHLDGRPLPVEQWPVSRVLRGLRVEGEEYVTRRLDTGQRWVIRFHGEPVRGDDGRVEVAVVISSDVTERAERAAQLDATQARFSLALSGSPGSLFEQDRQLRYTWFLNSAAELTDRLLGATDDALFPPAEAEALTRMKREVLDTGVAARRRVRITLDGRPRHYDTHVEPLRGPDGAITGVRGVSWDITEQVEIQAALAASGRQFQALADAMPQLVWTATAAGVADYYNARAKEYAGVHQRPDGTWSWELLLHPDDLQRTSDTWHRAVADGSFYACEHRVQMADGSFRWHISRATRVSDAPGGPRWFGTATDVHELKMAEAQVLAVSATRDRIFSAVAHDLRTPLGVLSSSEVLLAPMVAACVDPELRRRGEATLVRNRRQVARMERLLQELSDVAALKAGQPVGLTLAPQDLVEVVSRVVSEHGSGDPAHPVRLHERAGPLPVLIDVDRMERVILNLLSNASKYSPAGAEITVTVDVDGPVAVVRVHDRGIGVAPDELERIFDWYTRGSNAEQMSPGTGIGLAGARAIVSQHGGTITVESALQEGSTFTVRLPLAGGATLPRPPR